VLVAVTELWFYHFNKLVKEGRPANEGFPNLVLYLLDQVYLLSRKVSQLGGQRKPSVGIGMKDSASLRTHSHIHMLAHNLRTHSRAAVRVQAYSIEIFGYIVFVWHVATDSQPAPVWRVIDDYLVVVPSG
jgi:hypothetical protein